MGLQIAVDNLSLPTQFFSKEYKMVNLNLRKFEKSKKDYFFPDGTIVVLIVTSVFEIKVLFCAATGCKDPKNGALGHLFMCYSLYIPI